MGFKQDYAKLLARAAGKEDQLVRASALGLGAAIVEKSPVDTGRFRANWQYGAENINFSTSSPDDKTGATAVGRVAMGLQLWKRGQSIFVTNSLPYAKRLEYDAWSQQARAGMVRISVVEFKANIKKQAASL